MLRLILPTKDYFQTAKAGALECKNAPTQTNGKVECRVWIKTKVEEK